MLCRGEEVCVGGVVRLGQDLVLWAAFGRPGLEVHTGEARAASQGGALPLKAALPAGLMLRLKNNLLPICSSKKAGATAKGKVGGRWK